MDKIALTKLVGLQVREAMRTAECAIREFLVKNEGDEVILPPITEVTFTDFDGNEFIFEGFRKDNAGIALYGIDENGRHVKISQYCLPCHTLFTVLADYYLYSDSTE